MAGNKHIKRYKALADLQQALSEGKITSPGIIALDDESVHYDNNLKSIYPQYVINKGDFDWESFKIYNVKPEENDEPVYIETEFSLDKEFYDTNLEGGSLNLTITSNKPWFCRYNSEYCYINSTSGNGDKTINITLYEANYSQDINIDFYVEDKKITTFSIYQYAYEDMPLTFEMLEDGELSLPLYISKTGSLTSDEEKFVQKYRKTIYYSIIRNNKLIADKWELYVSGNHSNIISYKKNDIIKIYGDNSYFGEYYNYYTYATYFYITSQFNIYGNINSLLSSNNFNNILTYTNDTNKYMFSYLFYNTKVVDASNLILKCTTLTKSCYSHMFLDCINLINVPKLPATTLASYCYSGMFKNCSSLIHIPLDYLSTTTLNTWCYSNMFAGCTSLLTVPTTLPATTLVRGCYEYMFYGCSSLMITPTLPAVTAAWDCYRYMFSNCTSLSTAPQLPATILAQECYENMFAGCINLIKSPDLLASTLVNSCYERMFEGCTKLNYIKCLATNISATNCIYNWVNGVASTGTFIKNPNMTSWPTSTGIPSGWTIQDAA